MNVRPTAEHGLSVERLEFAETRAIDDSRDDFALVEGFNPKIKLERTQTLMEGADHCDFRHSLEEVEGKAAGGDGP